MTRFLCVVFCAIGNIVPIWFLVMATGFAWYEVAVGWLLFSAIVSDSAGVKESVERNRINRKLDKPRPKEPK